MAFFPQCMHVLRLAFTFQRLVATVRLVPCHNNILEPLRALTCRATTGSDDVCNYVVGITAVSRFRLFSKRFV